MESYANVFDEEWENLRAMFCCDQDSDHGLNLETLSVLWRSSDESNSSNPCVVDDKFLLYPSDIDLKPNSSTVSLQYPSHDIYQFYPSNTQTSSNSNCNNSLLAQVFSDDAMEEILGLKQDVVGKGKMENSVGRLVAIADLGKETPLKRKYETLELPNVMEDEANDEKINKNPKKKTRVSRDNKNKKNLPPNKNQNGDNVEESNKSNEKIITINNNGRGNAQSSSSCSSEDDSNASQDFNGGLVNLNGKTRASRGAATDPQSLYARKRRERINERLRILQNLVPNGTKVDISTMLEEAVQYVKFLQLQIKLLSSDDMWMYAPIAYNGMDMGLYQNFSPTK